MYSEESSPRTSMHLGRPCQDHRQTGFVSSFRGIYDRDNSGNVKNKQSDHRRWIENQMPTTSGAKGRDQSHKQVSVGKSDDLWLEHRSIICWEAHMCIRFATRGFQGYRAYHINPSASSGVGGEWTEKVGASRWG